MTTLHIPKKGILGWFAAHPVASNLVMLLLIISGFLTLSNMVTETFPTIDPKIITITVPYPGATPVDVEEGVTRRVEEAVLGVQGVKRVTSSAVENAGIITVELDDFADGQQALNDVENEVRRLSNFPPADAENFIIVKSQPRGDVMTLAVSGDVPEKILHDWAERIESDLIQLPNISLVDQSGGRIREISLEISVDTLSKYNLTLQDIADKIRQGSLDVPAGIMRTESGEILLRVQERKYYAEDYGNIVIKARNDGTIIRLKDIATLVDGFEDIELKNYYNGKPALFIDIKRSPNQDTITLNNEVKDYLTKLSLPKGMEVNIWKDSTIILKDRINLLVRNAITGFALVFLVLILFLDLKLAFWTSIGIPVSFLGGIMVAHLFGVSLNMITLFALIVVLGIVVDDAIVVGEAVFTEQERGKTKLQAVLDGVNDVAAPVTVGVLTTIGAFAPLVFTTGTFGQILQTIPIVVISVLFVSLLEAFIIFPSHIKHGDKWSMRPLADVRNYCSNGLEKFVENFLYPSVRLAVAYRYLTTVVTIILVFLAITLIQSGQIRITFFPNIESDDINVELIMPIGTPADVTDKHIQNILDKLNQIVAKYDKQKDDLRPVGEDNKPISILKNVSVTIGKIQSRGGPVGGSSQDSGGHVAALEAELLPPGERSTATKKIQEEWQKAVGTIPGAVSLSFDSGLVRRGNDFDYELSHKDNKQLEKAANIMTERIKAIEGVVNVEDSFEKGKQEFVFELKDTGYAAGLTPSYLGQQIRAAYFGAEVQRIQRDQNELKVMVRLPAQERKSLETIQNLKIRLPNGKEAALSTMADIKVQRGYSIIKRVDGRRIVSVSGDIDESQTTSSDVNAVIIQKILPQLQKEFIGLNYSIEGSGRDQAEDLDSIKKNMLIALAIIFAMIAVQLNGYIKPFIIMTTIPIGLAGAIFGHYFLGFDLSFVSMFGLVALGGVVVNDSIVLVDYYNKKRESGMNAFDSACNSTRRRFRPVLLTTATTAIGLLPILTETSLQAQFLIPMAISLACGIMFSTAVLIFSIPSLLMIEEDFRVFFRNLKSKLVQNVG